MSTTNSKTCRVGKIRYQLLSKDPVGFLENLGLELRKISQM
jgi:hypothetical protein